MKIKDKLYMDHIELAEHGPINIVAFGDSVTHGGLLNEVNFETVYMFFLFRAFEKANMYELADEYINSLRSLIDLGCTTTPEWIGEDVRSECHAWSAVAIYEFTAKVLGVTYENNTIYIKPYIEGRTFAKGEVATPCGMVYVEWEIKDNTFTINLKLPENKKANLTMPDGTGIVVDSGKYRRNL